MDLQSDAPPPELNDHHLHTYIHTYIHTYEGQGIVRLGNKFRERIKEISESSNIIEGTKKIHKREWLKKVTHGYHQTQIESQENIDTQKTNKWLSLRLSSHIEGFVCALQEQEIDTKSLRKRREKDIEKRKKIDSVCRVCRKQEETLYHVIGSCPVLAATLYLKRRYNQVAKIIYQEKMKNEKLIDPPDVTKTAEAEMWWDQKVKTVARVEHNRPDMVFWDTKTNFVNS